MSRNYKKNNFVKVFSCMYGSTIDVSISAVDRKYITHRLEMIFKILKFLKMDTTTKLFSRINKDNNSMTKFVLLKDKNEDYFRINKLATDNRDYYLLFFTF